MPNFDAGALAAAYVNNGASALSVLTNVDHFQGSIDDLETARRIAYPAGVPVLRKEFMFDPYQVYEARAYGADLVLLIVAMLDADDIRSLQALAHDLGMQCLIEVHDEGGTRHRPGGRRDDHRDKQPRPSDVQDRH